MVRTSVSMRRFSLMGTSQSSAKQHNADPAVDVYRASLSLTCTKQVVATVGAGKAEQRADELQASVSLQRCPRLQEPVKAEQWLRADVILELFPLTPAKLVRHADLHV
jgi:hypothetical protein